MFGLDSVASALLREYKLLYKMKASLTARPLLLTVIECDRTGICLPSTTFKWNEGDARFKDIPLGNQFGEFDLIVGVSLITIDLNGDGMDDIYFRRRAGGIAGPKVGAYRFGTSSGLGSDF